jgi:hypothetical protein
MSEAKLYEDRHERAADELVGDLLIDVDAGVANGIHGRLAAGLAALERTRAVPAEPEQAGLLSVAKEAARLLDKILDGEVVATRATAQEVSNRLHSAVKAAEAGRAQAGLSAGQMLGLVAAQAKVLDLHQECGDHYCEFHSGKEEEFAHECQTCDSIDRLRAAKSDLGDLLLTLPEAAEAGKAQVGWVECRHGYMPPAGEKVLFWCRGWLEGATPGIGDFRGDFWEDETQAENYGDAFKLIPINEVTHWMPLPAPPSPPTSKEGA